jgi:hypothetical protein
VEFSKNFHTKEENPPKSSLFFPPAAVWRRMGRKRNDTKGLTEKRCPDIVYDKLSYMRKT